MADSQFPWDELVDLITRDQRVVPIIGPELCVLDPETGATFDEVAARQLAERCGVQLQGQYSLPRLAQDLITQGKAKASLCKELASIHREHVPAPGSTTPAIPEPLRNVTEIRDFPLILTTTTDGLLAAAIRQARERDPGPIAASLGAATDLPRNWSSGPKPTLYHLLGRIGALPTFSLTEEDTHEFLHRMQSEAHRPEQLFDELRTRHLLLVGVRFNNWLMRFFLRALHGVRLSEDTGQLIVISGDAVRRDAALSGFLRETSRRVLIYEEGTGAEFMAELRRRWHIAHDEPWGTHSEGQEAPPEPDVMQPGSVFLSCARGDRCAAERLAAVLDEAGLDAWFDRNELQTGPRYEYRIRQYIQQCDLFVPLLSAETDASDEAFYRKEWNWALERSEALDGGSRFVMPVCVDDSKPQNLPAPLRKIPVQSAPGGQPAPDFVSACVSTVRQTRARRAV
jgi:hypothetical protein